MSGDVFKPLKLQAARGLALCLLLVPFAAPAKIGTLYQMQLGNPSGASANTNNHTNYLIQRTVEALDYSDNLGEPNWASWNLTASDIGTNTRSSFITDTNLPPNFYWVASSDYTYSGYDRGHLCPSKDRTDFATNNDLVFFMSNIMPQAPTNNSGVWATFEGYCRSLVQSTNNYELLIICGPSGFTGARINTNGPVSIPDYVWKIVVVVAPGSDMATNRITATNRVIALKIPNTNEATNSWESYITSANQIQADTGLTFFTALPADVAAALRAKVDGSGIISAWDVSGVGDFGPITLAPTTNAPNLAVVGLTRGNGVGTSGTGATGGWGGTGFTSPSAAIAVNADQFVTFSLTASNGYKVSFSSVSRFDYRRSTKGPSDGLLQFQVGSGAFTDITDLSYPTDSTAGASIGAIDLAGFAPLQNVGANTKVTFRIVNFGGTDSGGTWYIYDKSHTTAPDFAIQGTVAQVLAPALAPVFSLLSFTNHQFRFTVTGSAGTNYVVQAATNLAGPVWIPVATNLAPFQFIESNAVCFQQRFYRATTAP